jgi:hypothetical protein
MRLGLGNMLGRRMALASLDPDAKGYIDAVVAAGGTVSDAQKTAVDTFYRTGKSDGWYSSLKRMYLPIWAAAAPNAICMTSLTSGTFVGTVTHAAGYIQGNGTTGYFDPGASGNLRTLGMSGSTLHYMLGVSQQGTLLSIPMGVWDGAALNRCQLTNELTPNSTNLFSVPEQGAFVANNSSPRDGILIGSCTTASSRYLHRRKTAGTTVASNTIATAANVPNGQPYIMARSNLSPASTSLYYDGRIFAASYGLAIAQSDAESLSLALKNLYEGATGLTLP